MMTRAERDHAIGEKFIVTLGTEHSVAWSKYLYYHIRVYIILIDLFMLVDNAFVCFIIFRPNIPHLLLQYAYFHYYYFYSFLIAFLIDTIQCTEFIFSLLYYITAHYLFL